MDSLDTAIESEAAALVGSVLQEVRYYEIPFGLREDHPWDHDAAHVLDFGVDLVTDRGTVGITWKQYGNFGYGLDLVKGPLLDTRANAVQVCHAEDASPWHLFQGQLITVAKVHWFEAGIVGEDLVNAPIALTIACETGKTIALVCSNWNGPGQPLFPTGNDVVVLWTTESLQVLVPYLPDDLLNT